MKKLSKTIWTIAMGMSLLALFSTCSGTLGGASGIVRIAIPGVGNASSGRFVDSTTMTGGYVILIEGGDQVSSFVEYTRAPIDAGEVILSNIAEGPYMLGVILKDGDEMVTGLALEEITVKPGYNAVTVTVGPGIRRLEISEDGLMINKPFDFENNEYSVSFAKDTMIFKYGKKGEATVKYYPTFGVDSLTSVGDGQRRITSIEASLIDANGGLEPASPFTADDQKTTNASATVTVPAGNKGVQFKLTDSENATYTYKLILE